MALANVAFVLASNKQRVLVIDWDLEAPGLHRYFSPFLADSELTGDDSQGLLEFVLEFALRAAIPLPKGQSLHDEWFEKHADISRWSQPLCWPSGTLLNSDPSWGAIDFVPAGRQNRQYAERVNTFDWGGLYRQFHGTKFFEAVKRKFIKYDYVLIDSRTGVSDTSGICTVQMPDTVVLCFTLNKQSITGAAAVAASIREQQPSGGILPIAMRVDGSEKRLADSMKRYARETFSNFLNPSLDVDRYWFEMEVPYLPRYAYAEVLAPFEEQTGISSSLLPSMERLTNHVSAGRAPQMGPLTEANRLAVLARFQKTWGDGNGGSVQQVEPEPAQVAWLPENSPRSSGEERPLKLLLSHSKASRSLAQAFRSQLLRLMKPYGVNLHVETWTDTDTPTLVLERLATHIQGDGDNDLPAADFFAVLLTRDCANCLFELGLFLGATNFDKRRCFVMSSLPPEQLPSDLAGWNLLRFNLPSAGSGREEHLNTVKDLAREVRDQIYRLREYIVRAKFGGLRTITGGELAQLERPIEQGGQLEEFAEVLINRGQPVELSQREHAARVASNIEAGISYRYFFHDLSAYPIIGRLLFRLASESFDKDNQLNKALRSSSEISGFIRDHLTAQVSISLLPSPGPIEYSIHNASSPDSAACYLRVPFNSQFVAWCNHSDAVRIGFEMKDEDEACEPIRIFRPTKKFDINKDLAERAKLWAAIKKQFFKLADDELQNALSVACFGEILE